MTKLKLQSKINAGAAKALEPHVQRIFDNPGAHLVGVVELAHAERLQAAPGADKDDYVAVRITALEVADGDQDEVVRTVLRALYLQRTARGTFDEQEAQVEIDLHAAGRLAMTLHEIEITRLRSGLMHWIGKAQGADRMRARDETDAQYAAALRKSLKDLTAGLDLLLYKGPHGDDADA